MAFKNLIYKRLELAEIYCKEMSSLNANNKNICEY